VTVNAGGLAILGAFNGSGSFTDSDLAADSFTATVNYGDGSGTRTLMLSGTTFSLSHRYTILGTFTLTVTITDSHGLSGHAQTTVTAL
jgi:hypothetical protein